MCAVYPQGQRQRPIRNGNLDWSCNGVPPTICPANSTVSGSTCICKKGFAPNGPAANACVLVVPNDGGGKPGMCNNGSAPPTGKPIYPDRGVER